MTYRGLVCAIQIALAMAGAVHAQEATVPNTRPPSAPDRTEESPETEQEDARPMFGPPAPPAWAALRESDKDYAACLSSLRNLGATFEELPPVAETENPDCGIARPINVTAILPKVLLEGDGRMRCDTALSLARWSDQFVLPALALMPDRPQLSVMRLGTGYDCRDRVGTDSATARMSEHAFGNAVDIMTFVLEDGTEIPVQPRSEDGDLIEAFQRVARSSACLYFTTVLGPGSNEAHDDHLHFDIIERSSGFRICD